MKRLVTPAVVALAAILVVGVVSAIGTSKKPDPTTTTITLVGRQTSFNLVDNPPKGEPSGGDLFTFTENLFDRSGKRVGRDQIYCVDINPTGDIECTGRAFLPGGQIAVSFALDFNTGISSGAITGGTGAYRTAGGTVEAAARPDGMTTDITLEVVTLD